MAKNLRAKLPVADSLLVHDINQDAARKLAAECDTASPSKKLNETRPSVVIADSPRQLAEQAVGWPTSL